MWLLFACVSVAFAARFPQRFPSNGGYQCVFQRGQWGPCSATCGAGVQSRFNQLQTPGRPGCPPTEEQRPCLNLPPCPQALPRLPYGKPAPYGQVETQQAPVLPNPYPVDCERKPNGLYPDPQNSCSHVYYVCANGVTSELKCAGRLFFDVDLETCSPGAHVKACGGHPPPPVTTTHAPYTVPTPAPELDCKEREDGLYPDPAQKCSHAYFVCDHGVTSKMFCPPQLFFDEKQQECDSWVNTFACSGKQFTEPEVPVPDHKEPEPVDFDCSGREDGQYPDEAKKCSERFFHCTNKIAYEKWCPGNTYFDAEYGVCNIYGNIPDCSGKPRPPVQGEGGPRVVVMKIELASPLHKGYGLSADQLAKLLLAMAQALKVSPSVLHKVESPSAKAMVLTADYSILATVSKLASGYQQLSLYWNGQHIPVTRVTVVNVLDGQRLPPAPRPVYDFDCSERYDGNYAKDSCAYEYWACVGGETEKMACPEGLFYDADLDQCEGKNYVIGCGGSPRTTTTTLLPPPALPSAFDCERKENGFYTLEQCSQTFYHCSNGEANELRCPGKTFWDQDEKACNTKAQVKACGGGRPSPYGKVPRVPQLPPRPSPYRRTAQRLVPAPQPQRYSPGPSVPSQQKPALHQKAPFQRRPLPRFPTANRYGQ